MRYHAISERVNATIAKDDNAQDFACRDGAVDLINKFVIPSDLLGDTTLLSTTVITGLSSIPEIVTFEVANEGDWVQ